MNNEKNLNKSSGNNEKEHSILSDALKHIDSNFPLSGGESEEDFDEAVDSLDSDEDDSESDITEREHLDTNFPLSGGTQ